MGLEDDQDLLLAIALSKSLMVEREGEDDDAAETSATSKDAALLEAAEAASLYDEPEEAHKQNLADFLATLVRGLNQLGGEERLNASEPPPPTTHRPSSRR